MNPVARDDNDFLEKQLLPLWKKYTLEAPNLKTDFFESGGDSLAAINFIVDLRKIVQVDISLENFMRNPTIPFLMEYINTVKTGIVHE
jgi:acyl carrier protein